MKNKYAFNRERAMGILQIKPKQKSQTRGKLLGGASA